MYSEFMVLQCSVLITFRLRLKAHDSAQGSVMSLYGREGIPLHASSLISG